MRSLAAGWTLAACLLAPAAAFSEVSSLRLSVETTAGREVARLVVENVSPESVRLYLDARSATVELLGPRGRRDRCSAPPRGRVEPQPDRFVDLAPGARAREEIDLRFHCFGPRLRRLAEAERLRLLYRSRVGADHRGRSAWTGRLESEPIPFEPRPPEAQPEAQDGSPGDDALRLTGDESEVDNGDRVPVVVELRAAPRARIPVLIRPNLFAFTVIDPKGAETSCTVEEPRIRPIDELFDRLGSRRVTLDLTRFCPRRTFEEAGIYQIRPSFSSEHGGEGVGTPAWTGRLEGEPFLIRVRRSLAGTLERTSIEVTAIAGREEAEGAR